MLALASMTYNTYLGLAVLAKARWLQALWLQAAVSSFTALCICNWHCVTDWQREQLQPGSRVPLFETLLPVVSAFTSQTTWDPECLCVQ